MKVCLNNYLLTSNFGIFSEFLVRRSLIVGSERVIE